MLIIPAVDMLGGHCVRLYKGNYGQSQVYNDDPLETARSFEKAGAKLIHLVDLDAARGKGNNRPLIHRICSELNVEVEIGGGIRSEEDVEQLLEAGARRLILGTLLAHHPEIAEEWIKKYPQAHFIAGIDALDGEVKVSGWEKESGIQDSQLAVTAAKMGFKGIIYTNIARDGTLSGPDISNTARIAKGIWGIITGKAVYEGRIDVAQAVKEIQGNEEEGKRE